RGGGRDHRDEWPLPVVLDGGNALKARLDGGKRLFAGQQEIAALNDGPAVVGQHKAEEAVDIEVFGGARHLRVHFQDCLFNGSAVPGLGERRGAGGGTKNESS